MSSEASKITAIKDQAVGSIKETIGTMTGNQKMELEGKAQKIHGKNEFDYAKAFKQGESEPEKFRQAYHPAEECSTTDHAHATIEGENPSELSGMKDQFVGGVKSTFGSATGNQDMELKGKAQEIHGRNQSEFAKAQKDGLSEPQHFEQGTKTTDTAQGQVVGDNVSSFSSVKDRAVGSIKESVGALTGNQSTELAGKAQAVHGRNEAEFVKAERKGLSEPEHFASGTKTTDKAEGTVEGDSVSSLSAIKDRVVGAVKETVGSVTGDQKMELIGKAQNVHGRNEAEFAKAQRQGFDEPEHFAQGTKTCDQASGTVEGENLSSLSAMKDRAVGSIKSTVGSVTGNQETELIGKAQQVHGRNESQFIAAQKEGLSEPEHYVHGTKTSEQSKLDVEQSASSISALKDRAVGAIKSTVGSATGNADMELIGKAQSVHGRNESEFAKAQREGHTEPENFVKPVTSAESSVSGDSASSLSGLKDRAVGAIKSTVGTATGDSHMELLGKAQNVHGRNEAEFAKAERHGLSEPENFIKPVESAQGSVEESSSSLSALKDRAVGAVKASVGSATGDQKMELIGKAQQVHGRNEAEFSSQIQA